MNHFVLFKYLLNEIVDNTVVAFWINQDRYEFLWWRLINACKKVTWRVLWGSQFKCLESLILDNDILVTMQLISPHEIRLLEIHISHPIKLWIYSDPGNRTTRTLTIKSSQSLVYVSTSDVSFSFFGPSAGMGVSSPASSVWSNWSDGPHLTSKKESV